MGGRRETQEIEKTDGKRVKKDSCQAKASRPFVELGQLSTGTSGLPTCQDGRSEAHLIRLIVMGGRGKGEGAMRSK